jgi:hypothetical protein
VKHTERRAVAVRFDHRKSGLSKCEADNRQHVGVIVNNQ